MDSLIAICNKESEILLQNSGKYVLLGEMIGQSVKEVITEALSRQTKMTPTRQASIEWQTKRYGITKEAIVSECLRLYPHLKKEVAETEVGSIDRDNRLVAAVAAIAHLCDQNRANHLRQEHDRHSRKHIAYDTLRRRHLRGSKQHGHCMRTRCAGISSSVVSLPPHPVDDRPVGPGAEIPEG